MKKIIILLVLAGCATEPPPPPCESYQCKLDVHMERLTTEYDIMRQEHRVLEVCGRIYGHFSDTCKDLVKSLRHYQVRGPELE